MRMNSIKKIFLLLFLGIMMGACEEMFDPDKDNSYDLQRALKDPSFANGILDRAYVLLPNSFSAEDVATDNAVSNVKNNNFLRMATGEWSSIFNPLNVWNSSYDAIFHINYMLMVIDKNEWAAESQNYKDLTIKRLRGEALGLRGYYYMRLLIHHGGMSSDNTLLGVPLITEVISVDDNWKLPRNTYQQCIAQIEADFNAASGLLPYEWLDVPGNAEHNQVMGKNFKNRINGKSIKALPARLALHTGSPAFNNGNYNAASTQKAATLAGELLKEIDGINGMDPQGFKFYISDNISEKVLDPSLTQNPTPEILWRNNHYTNNTIERQSFPPSRFGNGDVNPTQNLVDAFPMANGYPITDNENSGYNAANPYTNRDPRLVAYVLYNGNRLNTTVINTHVDSPVDGIDNTTTSTRTGYYMLKLLRPTVNLAPNVNSSARHFYPHVRYTEIFLIYAEAANEAWGPDADPNNYGFTARNVIAALRKRAGISATDQYLASKTTKGAMAELIRNERRLELCFEGFRFWDLRRWKADLNETAKGMKIIGSSFNKIDVEDRNYQSHMYYGPVPNMEIVKYKELVQNQGW
jgi:starch-binding outer membrane protein, SusD/RagB family